MDSSGHSGASVSTELLTTSTPEETIRVYLRLRPKNKLEALKRSKDCVRLHENPNDITVESPLLGESTFSFDQVFDEFSTQEEVYRECLSSLPQKLIQGINVTVFAYGPRGTGKTYTLLGEGRGADLATLAVPTDEQDGSTMDTQSDNSLPCDGESMQSGFSDNKLSQDPQGAVGMTPRLISSLFDMLYDATPSDSSVQYSIRCSYVEIYLEKMTDLLHPGGGTNTGLRIGRTVLDKEDQDVCVLGATELCCLCPEDVFAMLARGQAARTKSAEDANLDSSRSHAVFTLQLEQIDIVTGKVLQSRLQVVDCAGCQRKSINSKTDNPTSIETSMINTSLSSLQNAVRWRLDQQENPSKIDDRISSSSFSKIASLLIPSIGETTQTVMICTGAPSSHNIDDTIHAIRFAQIVRQIKNRPQARLEGFSFQIYRSKLAAAARKEQQLTKLITMMAQEAKYGKKKTREPKNPKVWDAILQICETDKKKQKKNGDGKKKKKKDKNKDDDDDADLCISCYNESEQQSEIQDLYSKIIELESNLQRERTAREKVESKHRDMSSELAALKSQNELLVQQKRQLEAQVSDAKAEIKAMTMTKIDVENRLRTSQFRENEAVLFLRQLRTFYFRLLKNKAAQGSGSTKDTIQEAKKRLPGVADLEDLLDVDKMMVQSGIIESSEVGSDTLVADYIPSDDALAKSSMEGEMAEKREPDMINQQLENIDEISGEKKRDHVSITNSHESRTKNGLTYGQLASCRQKLLDTPAGLLALQKERELELELAELSKKCIGLQNSLNAEKAMVEALSGRQGAVNKMKQAQEVIMLKTELERRSNDLLAIVWKMNELHLVNKTIDTKVGMREQHVTYLEEHISDIQAKTRRLLSQQELCEKKLRDENSNLRGQLEGLSVNLWQLGENLDKAPVWRLSIPFSGDDINLDEFPDCRQSTGELEEGDIDALVEEMENAP
ncbi:kinesin motor domain containing protein [Nitzschia inconspicua]|uniref:Kinesin motor domain containing protein n=1 Tax=Nitzschia inconspicua TaxID=303405 RepID=A0A9K3PV45_9STRA|nr:kinesin motor domain containing protein [Nitzschia inconspicua]